MKGYKIYRNNMMGFDYDEKYAINYSKAIQEFNNLLRKSIKNVYCSIDKSEFSEEVTSFREYKMNNVFNNKSNKKIELICRKCPFILYKEDGKLIAKVLSWEEPDYEYGDADIISEDIVLEEIELIE